MKSQEIPPPPLATPSTENVQNEPTTNTSLSSKHERNAEVTLGTDTVSSVTPVDITGNVLSVIATQTGYEITDLDLEYELEADLGIDTVKQAELFAELRESFNIPDEIQIEMTSAPTIQSLIDWFTTHSTSTTPISSEEVDTTSESRPTLSTSEGEGIPKYTEVVLSTLAEQTGYEITDLDLEYELEADLGIDTVKQAELFAELRESFNIPDEIQIEMTSAPTIQSLIDWFTTHGTPAESELTKQEQSEAAESSTLSGQPSESTTAQSVDDANFTPYILRTHWESNPITHERPITNKSFRLVGSTINDRQLIRALELKGLQQQTDGAIVIERGAMLKRYLRRPVHSTQNIFPIGCVYWKLPPNDHSAHIALKGGRSGLAKALAQEWPGCKSKVIWVQSRITSKDLADIIHQELRSIDSVTEVYYENEDRFALTLQKESAILQPQSAPKTMVFSGGARGVTSEIAKGFIRYGCDTVFLLGRTPPAKTVLDLDTEKNRIKGE